MQGGARGGREARRSTAVMVRIDVRALAANIEGPKPDRPEDGGVHAFGVHRDGCFIAYEGQARWSR